MTEASRLVREIRRIKTHIQCSTTALIIHEQRAETERLQLGVLQHELAALEAAQG